MRCCNANWNERIDSKVKNNIKIASKLGLLSSHASVGAVNSIEEAIEIPEDES